MRSKILLPGVSLGTSASKTGRPQPAAKPSPSAVSSPPSSKKPIRRPITAKAAHVIKKRCFDHARPACAMRTLSEADLARRFDLLEGRLDLLATRLLLVARRTCSRRGRIRSHHALLAFFSLLLSGQDWIKQDPGDAADRDRNKEEHWHVLHGTISSGPACFGCVVGGIEGGGGPLLLGVG